MKEESSNRSINSFDLYPTDTALHLASSEQKKIFKTLVLINIVLNLDTGVIPGSLVQIKSEIPLSYTETACLVSLSYLGLSFAAFLTSSILQKFSATKTLVFSLCMNCAFCLMFSFSYSIPFMMVSRIGMGITQSFCVVYSPVWINEFSPKQKESLWMGFLQASVPVGVVIGYSLAASLNIFEIMTWRFSIQLQALLELPLIVYLAHLNPDEIDVIDHSQDSYNLAGLKDQLKMLFANKLYLLLSFSLWSLYFVVAGIQYWVTLYMIKVMKQDLALVIAAFVTASITAPLSGVYLGGRIIEFIGGYKGKNLVDALWICFIASVLAAFCSFPASIAQTVFGEFMSLWMMLFFGAVIVPCATGVCVNCVEKEYQANTSSFLQICSNFGGFFLSPLASAMFMQRFDDEVEGLKWGFRMVLGISWVGCGFMGVALWASRR